MKRCRLFFLHMAVPSSAFFVLKANRFYCFEPGSHLECRKFGILRLREKRLLTDFIAVAAILGELRWGGGGECWVIGAEMVS